MWRCSRYECVSERLRPLQGPDRGRRLAPFILIAVAGAISLAIPPWPRPGPTLTAGVVILMGILVGAAFLPWARWPAWPQAVPALAFYVALALLRHAAGGSASGLAPLAALPVVWLALYGSRAGMTAAVAGCGTTFLAPLLLFGAPLYPVQDWRRAVLWSAVAVVLGTSIHRLVRSNERQTASLDALLSLTHQMDDATPAVARGKACAVAAKIMGASFSALMEPDGEGNLVSTATAGMDLPQIVVPLSGQVSGSLIAFNTGRRLFVADTTDSPLVAQQLVAAVGAASMVFEPVHREGQVVGVLGLAYSTAQTKLHHDSTAVLELITQQLAALTTRVDLLNRLETLAADASDMVGRYALTDDGFRFSYASRSAHTLLGRQPDTLIGTSPLDLVHPDDKAALAPVPAALLAGRPVTTVAYRAAHADGHWVWLESTIRPVVDAMTGRITEVQASSRDVSDRKRMELELRHTNALFAGVLNAATEYSIIGTDPEGTINVFNTGAERLLGYSAAEMIGHATPALIHDPTEIADRARELGAEPGFEAFVALARRGRTDSREWTFRSLSQPCVTLRATPSASSVSPATSLTRTPR